MPEPTPTAYPVRLDELINAIKRVHSDVLWDEPLLRGLFGDAHALADIGPGGARAAGLIDEVAD